MRALPILTLWLAPALCASATVFPQTPRIAVAEVVQFIVAAARVFYAFERTSCREMDSGGVGLPFRLPAQCSGYIIEFGRIPGFIHGHVHDSNLP